MVSRKNNALSTYSCPSLPGSPVAVPAELESCSTIISGSDGSQSSSPCSNSSSPDPIYTNIVPYGLEGDWNAVFLGPSTLPLAPAYVTGFSVGVAVSDIRATLYRASSKLPTFDLSSLGATVTERSKGI